MKVLLAHDGSQPSDKALDTAVELCGKFGAQLVLLTVVPELCLLTEEISPSDCELVSNVMLADGRASAQRAGALAEAKGIKPETLIREGRPAETIVEAANELDAAFIVVGSTGKHGASKAFWGSVSAKVAEYAQRTVVIVK
jgi:nucleotide-binding universal stress UspA family protein